MSESPPDGGTAASVNSAAVTFDRDVFVDSFTESVGGSNVPGFFLYSPDTFTATFFAFPPQVTTGLVTVTVLINQNSACPQTITWTYTVPS